MRLCLLEKHYGSVVGHFDNTNEKEKKEWGGTKKEKKRKQKETWPQASGPREHPCPRFGDYTPDSLYIIHCVIFAERAEEPQTASRPALLPGRLFRGRGGSAEGLCHSSPRMGHSGLRPDPASPPPPEVPGPSPPSCDVLPCPSWAIVSGL